MDTVADRNITFDSREVCCHCSRYDTLVGIRIEQGEKAREALDRQVARIKRDGKGREYDCIVGVSGGVDSTYVAYLVKQLGLRPLAIHFDNGWNSELAVRNIEHVMTKAGIDLYTYVVDWEEFRDIQISFLKASTPDGEVPTDHAISALLWREAAKRGIRYIISGMNFATESISIPDWAYGHSDWRYIKDVHKRFGSGKSRSYPRFGLLYLLYVNVILRVRVVSILNYVEYNKERAMSVLQQELGWSSYGGKHHESIYTRFFQGYVLPKKFGIDKRYGHLSDLINSGQLTREQAIREMCRPTYDECLQQQDLTYVTKKLGLTKEEFSELMKLPVRSFRDYKNSFSAVQLLRTSVNMLRGLGLYPK